MDVPDAEYRLSRMRDEKFALLLTEVICLAAEQYPEELRRALASIFDLTAIQKQHDDFFQKFHLMYQDWLIVRDGLGEARIEQQKLREEIGGLRHTVLKIRQWLQDKVKPLVLKPAAGSKKAAPPPT